MSWINGVLAPILGLLQFIAREYENWRQRKAAQDAFVRAQLEEHQRMVEREKQLEADRERARNSADAYERMRERARKWH